jgi:hypothetical protein
VFFLKKLFRDYEVQLSKLIVNLTVGVFQVHHWLVLLIFSVTFALSCTMFELIIFEILGVLDSRYEF